MTGDHVSLLEAFGLKHMIILYLYESACDNEQPPRGTNGNKCILAIYRCK